SRTDRRSRNYASQWRGRSLRSGHGTAVKITAVSAFIWLAGRRDDRRPRMAVPAAMRKVPVMSFWQIRFLGIPYNPQTTERPFLERKVVQKDDELEVSVCVLDDRESNRFFGVNLARRGMQPVWLQIVNHGSRPYRLRLASLDPNYYPPLEAAYLNHYAIGKRLLAFGLLAWWFLPFLILLPIKFFAARAA